MKMNIIRDYLLEKMYILRVLWDVHIIVDKIDENNYVWYLIHIKSIIKNND